METNTIVVIVLVALVALVVIGLVFWSGQRQRDADRRAQAEELREQLRREDTAVRHRESIAAETQARARAAQAEADAKSAEAERLQNAAEIHHSEVSASREQLEQHRQRAESLDAGTTRRRQSEAR